MKKILFDLDGTLLDTARDFLRLLNQLRQQHQLPPLSYAELRPHVAFGGRAMIMAAFNSTLFEKEFLELYLQEPVVDTIYFPGVQESLQYLIEKDIPFGIVTNKKQLYLPKILNHFPELQHASCIVCGDSAAYGKPHPAPLLLAAEQLHCPPEECVYVGDSAVDMEAARRAGMKGVVVTYGYGEYETLEQWGAEAQNVDDLRFFILKDI